MPVYLEPNVATVPMNPTAAQLSCDVLGDLKTKLWQQPLLLHVAVAGSPLLHLR